MRPPKADLTPATHHHSALFILLHEAVAILHLLPPGPEGRGWGAPALFFYLFYLFILAAPGLTCGTLDLFVAACGIQFPDPRD